ncbi:TPA: hypothetical protein ACGIK9_003431 [Acinetobacter baumannii]|uniref:hypothetical protein n=1 Tax=Acinetobacter baumannii TaxID=470 RepID=UPI00338E8B52
MSVSSAPSAYTTVLSLIDQLPYALLIGQSLFMLIALWCCYSALLDSITLGTKGQKYFSTRHQPTNGSVVTKVLLAGLLFVTADQLFTVGVMSSVFGDSASMTNSLVTLESYKGSIENQEARAGLTLIVLAAQIVGIFAVLHGIRIWIEVSDGISQHTIGRGFAFIFFGVCLFQIEFMHKLLSGMMGWDLSQLFKM